MFGLNDIFKYIEKHQQSQRQDWADTLSEIVLEGKERTRIEKLEDLLSQNPPLPEAVYNQLLCLHEQGFLLPRRYESNFFKMYYHREKLKHLRQTYEKENSVFFENELQNISHDPTTVSHLRRIMPSDGFVVSPLRMPSWGYPLLIFGKVVSSYSIIIPTLLSVAYITLLERKILASRQFRFGPNKVSWVGILQPIADALKLFSKQVSSPFSGNLFIYVISPILSMLLMLIIWGLAPLIAGSLSFKYSSVIILVILRFSVYPLLLSGWSSNRKYAMLGSLRGVAQTISYEISLALILLTILLYTSSYEIEEIIKFSKLLSLLFVIPHISLLWVISCIAETNRTPFDFSEGESELVSGFNIEYGSGLFALIFIAEYGRIFFLSIISASILMRLMSRSIMTHTIIITLVFLWIWSRTTLPRYRYDLLMALAWKAFLPFSLGILELSLSLITT